jgi:hypothetical protein
MTNGRDEASGEERARLRLFDEIDAELGRLEELQLQKVIELARRIHPGLTAEDIRNPHDFPDLDDPDWQYEDGMLAGMQSLRIAVRAMKSR